MILRWLLMISIGWWEADHKVWVYLEIRDCSSSQFNLFCFISFCFGDSIGTPLFQRKLCVLVSANDSAYSFNFFSKKKKIEEYISKTIILYFKLEKLIKVIKNHSYIEKFCIVRASTFSSLRNETSIYLLICDF